MRSITRKSTLYHLLLHLIVSCFLFGICLLFAFFFQRIVFHSGKEEERVPSLLAQAMVTVGYSCFPILLFFIRFNERVVRFALFCFFLLDFSSLFLLSFRSFLPFYLLDVVYILLALIGIGLSLRGIRKERR